MTKKTMNRREEFEENVVEVLEAILEGLVTDLDDLTIEFDVSESGSARIDVTGPRDEIGKVLGRHKAVVRGIETVLYAISRRHKFRLVLNVRGLDDRAPVAEDDAPRRRRSVQPAV